MISKLCHGVFMAKSDIKYLNRLNHTNKCAAGIFYEGKVKDRWITLTWVKVYDFAKTENSLTATN